MTDKATRFSNAIRREQARVILENQPLTLRASLVIAVCAEMVLWLNQPGKLQIVWIALFIVFTLRRIARFNSLQSSGITVDNAEAVLRLAARYAAVAGCLWGAVPVMLLETPDSLIGGFVIFLICGVSAGSLIQSTAYSPVAVNFVLPAMLGGLVSLLAEPTLTQLIVAVNLLLLTFMMVRASRRAEREFWDAQWLRLEATSLAESLEAANQASTAANARLQRLANHDTMTGLYNRAAFNDGLTRRLKTATERMDDLALLIIDLDNFKLINDTLGHGAGDRVIAEAARRVGVLARPTDLVARLGGDEFAVIVGGPDARRHGIGLARAIVDRMAAAMDIDGREIKIGASVGLSVFPDDAVTAEAFFASSDIALYEAKARGRHQAVEFNNRLKEKLEHQRRIEGDLPEALARRQLAVHFQAQVDIATGEIVGFEALIRWHHPALGAIPPPAIVAASQNLRLSEALTGFVIDAACDFISALDAAGGREAIVAINVSPVEFQLYSPAALILSRLAARGIPPRRLEVEITEEAILDTSAALADLARLATAGVRISVDDFGTGHSSLAHIADLKVDRLKIDRAFIGGLAGNRRHQALVEAILSLGRTLDIGVVAEGIETEADRQVLDRLGCKVGQGFLFGLPMSLDKTIAWLATERLRGAMPKTADRRLTG